MQVDQCCGQAQGDGQPPDALLRSARIVEPSCQPYPQKAADLVAETDDAVERRQVTRAENLRHRSAGQGHRGELKKPDHAAEEQSGKFRQRRDDKQADDHGATAVERAQEVFFPVAVAEPAGKRRAEDIG